ncbi:MAG TPA: ABC transporter ATP-binding protein [Hyphomicrobiales bacterium]|nr:ABC transporter ATP-binding protein [Hyphomicrobiales bacterium]
MTTPIVEANEVVKTFGHGRVKVRALKSVSLALEPGRLTLLMGPSGSGKTTLLSILGCMLRPDSGSVRICGAATEKAGPEQLAEIRRKHIGFVFQLFHLFSTLTAAENVQLALDVRGERGRKARARSRDMLAQVGLANRANAFPRELSGGEQQRVAIARAVVANPDVILADEPTAALDGDNGRAIMNILARIAGEQGSAVLVVTHDSRIIQFADRIIHIEDGILREQETPEGSVYPLRIRSFRAP